MKKLFLVSLLSILALAVSAQTDQPIPLASFSDITINMNFPQFRALKADGGFVEVDGGVRGIIVYREDEEHYLAFERNCPYEPEESCAKIDADISRLFIICNCCGSRFNFSDGYPSKGPASRQLRKYRISLSGNTLTVTDEIIF
jgi:nitrite reductase/ring-hydroxylating ferredoxin subunit